MNMRNWFRNLLAGAESHFRTQHSQGWRSYRPLQIEWLEHRICPDTASPTYVVFQPAGGGPANSSTPIGYTPAQIRQAYGINLVSADGTGETVAIIDANDDPELASRSTTLPLVSNNGSPTDTAFLASDLHQFDVEYGLPEPLGFFTKVNEQGQPSPLPSTDTSYGAEIEEALDVEWVHAVAPGANIILVEMNSLNSDDIKQCSHGQVGNLVLR